MEELMTTTGESALTRASTHLLRYLHDETKAVWTVMSHPIGTNFPILGGGGTPVGYLCIASDEQFPKAYTEVGTAVATALGVLAAVKAAPKGFDPLAYTPSLESALMHGKVIAYFQPIVELETGNVVALETLARWQTAEGVLSPDAFLDTLDQSGKLFDLFERMADEALQFIADYRHRRPDLSVAVNLDLETVPENGLPELVADLLARHDVRAEVLTIELNERVRCELNPAQVQQLKSLANMGVNLVAADFTTSADLMERLGGVPISGTKMSRRHVSQLAVGVEQRELVRSIIDSASKAGLEIIGEGVETHTQSEHLMRLGCKYGQGYYFAVPQPPSSLDAVLQAPLATTWSTR
jgi:EAL domain-containing protein (putative c-di-GMP-specific phosphodiesterase class I)